MAESSEDSSSKRHFHWTSKVGSEEEANTEPNSTLDDDKKADPPASTAAQRRKLQAIALTRIRSALAVLKKHRATHFPPGLGPRVVGTLFGHRRGHVHFAIQKDPGSEPAFLIELATPISVLVREMASGLVRIALECDKDEENKKEKKLLEEPMWRTFCNGKKCGFASRRECGEREKNVLKAVEMISMGAGVLPATEPAKANHGEGEGEVMYMRAKFERVVGSRDSEAFYMMNPDSNGAPELSVYLLRV